MADLTKEEEEIAQSVATSVANNSVTKAGSSTTVAGIKQALRWRQQCLLASSLGNIVGELGSKYKKPWRYTTSFSTNEGGGSTADFLNKLYRQENISSNLYDRKKDFMNITTSEMSRIGANISIHKVLYDGKKDDASGITEYTHRADIPIIPEQMAKQDMEDYNSSKQVKFMNSTGFNREAYASRPDTAFGVKSFNWSYVGANPETVRNDIEATLVLNFQSFNQLVRVYSTKIGDKHYNYSMLDLLGYGPESAKLEDKENERAVANAYEPAMVEIKATVSLGCGNFENNDLKAKIKNQKQTLFLTLIDHDFNIGQVAPFTLTLTYRARLEGSMAQMKSNVVFSPGVDSYDSLVNHDKAILKSRTGEGCATETTKGLIGQRDSLLKKAWKESFTAFFLDELDNDYMEDSSKNLGHKSQSKVTSDAGPITGKEYFTGLAASARQIWKAVYNMEDIGNWLDPNKSKDPPPPEKIERWTGNPAAESQIDLDNDDAVDENYLGREFKLGATGGTKHNIPFVLLGDILEVMAYRAFSKQNFLSTQIKAGSFGGADKIKIISGPVRLNVAGNAVTCSLSDVPIALESFADFWYQNVIRNGREVYSILDFIRDLGDQLLDKSLGADCAIGASSSIKGETQLNTGFISLAPVKDGGDPLLQLDGKVYNNVTGDIVIDNIKEPLLNPAALESAKSEDIRHYIVLYIKNQNDIEAFGGDQADDAERGVHHVIIHQGPFRSINFSKTDQPYLRETRYELLADNPLRALSNVYQISCEMFGNAKFYPGQMVFVNPISFATKLGKPTDKNSISSVMGLGGYHVITSVQHTWDRGGWKTSIVATWDNNGKHTVQESRNVDPCASPVSNQGVTTP